MNFHRFPKSALGTQKIAQVSEGYRQSKYVALLAGLGKCPRDTPPLPPRNLRFLPEADSSRP